MSDMQESNSRPTDEYGKANAPADPPPPDSLREVLGAASEVQLADALADAEATAGLSGRSGGGNDQTGVLGDLDEVHVGQTAAPDEEKRWSEVVADLPIPGTEENADAVNAVDEGYAYATSRATLDADLAPLAREVPADTESELGNVPSLDNTSSGAGAPTETLTPGPGEDTAPLAPDAPAATLDDLPNDADTSTVSESLAGTDLGADVEDAPQAETVASTTEDTDSDTAIASDDAAAPTTATSAAETSTDTSDEASDTPTTAEVVPLTAAALRAEAADDAADLDATLARPQVVVSSPMGMEQSSDPGNANPLGGGDAPVPQSISGAEAGIESLPPALEMKLQGTSAQTDPQATAQIEPPLPIGDALPEAVADATSSTEADEVSGAGEEGATGEGRQKRRRRRGGGGRQGRKLDSFSPGEELQGTVRSIQTYGAFIDVGAERDGLVHISELKDGFVEKVEDVVKEGDTVTVRIKDVDVEKGRLSLTMRAAPAPASTSSSAPTAEGADAPQERPERGERRERRGERDAARDGKTRLRDLTEGQEVTGTVSSIVEFGAFVDIGAATDGLIHISEMSEERVNRVTDILQQGQQVTARILSVDRKRNRISLTLRPQPDPTEFEIEDDGEEEIETPSAMELAFARARERNSREEREEKRRAERERNNQIMDDIIARTLGQQDRK